MQSIVKSSWQVSNVALKWQNEGARRLDEVKMSRKNDHKTAQQESYGAADAADSSKLPSYLTHKSTWLINFF